MSSGCHWGQYKGESERGEASLQKQFSPFLEHYSHCEEQSDEANQKIKIRLLHPSVEGLAMTHRTEGEGDKGRRLFEG